MMDSGVQAAICGFCGQQETRLARSSHIVDEVLAQSRNTIIEAELFAQIDAEYNLGVIDGDMDTARRMLDGFIQYGWAEIDSDGDALRTRRCKCDWTSLQQRRAEDQDELPRAWQLGWKRDHGHVPSCPRAPKRSGP